MTVPAASTRLKIIVFGLSLSSSWGNGHATTYRALLKALAARGHRILFLERNLPWYEKHRDLPDPSFCKLRFYTNLPEVDRFRAELRSADLVIIGSYVPDAIDLAQIVRPLVKMLAFYDIDTPVTLTQLANGTSKYMSREVIQCYDLYLSFTSGPALQVLEKKYHARRARALLCSVDISIYKPLVRSVSPRWNLGYLGTYSEDRQPALDLLLIQPARKRPDLRFVIAGPQYPNDPRLPENVQRIEHLSPGDHAEFYNSVAWALNITRANMVASGFSPSVRLFEAGACGAPIISDIWPGLETIFEIGTEIVTATSSHAVLEVLDRPEVSRRAIGQAGRRRVLGEHTAEMRAVLLETYIAEISGRSSDKPQGAAALG